MSEQRSTEGVLLTGEQAIDRLRALITFDFNRKALAKKVGCSPQLIYVVLRGAKPPPKRLLKLVGLEKVVMYREIKK